MGSASIKLNEDGSFYVLYGGTDIGTGLDTVVAQIVAETLGVKPEQVIVYAADTDLTPFDKGAYASSGTFISGGAVYNAALKIREIILEEARIMLGELDSKEYILEEGKVVSPRTKKSVSLSEIAYQSFYVKKHKQIMATNSFVSESSPPPFAAHFVEIEVDKETGIITPVKYVAAIDCGKIINPELVRGQTIGSIINGIGYALSEEYKFSEKGKLVNTNFMDYRIPSSRDIPEIKTILIDTFDPSGPLGAKSVAEISINGPIPAIGNAIYDAIGVRLHSSPYTPERILRELKKAQ